MTSSRTGVSAVANPTGSALSTGFGPVVICLTVTTGIGISTDLGTESSGCRIWSASGTVTPVSFVSECSGLSALNGLSDLASSRAEQSCS